MRISRTRFVIIFLVSAFTFQIISNSLLGPGSKFYPPDGNWYPGMNSPIGWKHTIAIIIYPIKFVLIQPLSFLGQDPDPVPPVILIAFAIYWTAMALVLYFILSKIKFRKKNV